MSSPGEKADPPSDTALSDSPGNNSNLCRGDYMSKEFFKVPNSIFECNLSASEIAVYAYMLRCADNKTRLCYPSYTKICESCRITRATAITAVSKLCEYSFIDKIEKGYSSQYGIKRANTYRVNWI